MADEQSPPSGGEGVAAGSAQAPAASTPPAGTPPPSSAAPAPGSEPAGSPPPALTETSLIGGQAPKVNYINADGTLAKDWTTHLPEELGDFRNKLTNYRHVTDLAKALHFANQTIGKKGVIVPTPQSSPEEIASFRKAMGVPDAVDEYTKGVVPDTIPDGLYWNEKRAAPYMEILHRNNIPPKAAKELADLRLKEEQLQEQARKTVAQQLQREGLDLLRQTWRSDYDHKLDLVKAGVATVHGNPDTYGLGDPEVIRIIGELANKLSEDTLVIADQKIPGGAMGMKAAAKDIQTNPNNPEYAKYWAGDPDVQAKVRRWHEQSEAASPRR